MRLWPWLLLFCVAACGAPDPCAEISGACVALRLDRSPMVSAIDLVDVDVTFGAHAGHAVTTSPDGQGLSLPAETALALQGLTMTSPIAVALSARLGARVVGTASAAASLGPSEHALLRVQLTPVTGDCLAGGLYCGGDKLAGEAQTLYRCTSGAPTLIMHCANGCAIHPDRDDACR